MPKPTGIHHITDISNLASIVQSGGLLCTTKMKRQRKPHTGIANQEVQERRGRTAVHCGPGGTLHDYVPLFFGLRSPMLYVISKGQVPGRRQGSVVHLVSTVEAVVVSGASFVFTDGHAIMRLTDFFTDPGDLDELDLEVLQGKWWNDTAEHPGRQRRREAEFLVHDFMDWHLVQAVGVQSSRMEGQVNAVLDGAATDHRPVVLRKPQWYY